MNATYQILSIKGLNDTKSWVQVEIIPSIWINGFTGGTISFEVTTENMKAEIEARVQWKIKQETTIPLKPSEIVPKAAVAVEIAQVDEARPASQVEETKTAPPGYAYVCTLVKVEEEKPAEEIKPETPVEETKPEAPVVADPPKEEAKEEKPAEPDTSVGVEPVQEQPVVAESAEPVNP